MYNLPCPDLVHPVRIIDGWFYDSDYVQVNSWEYLQIKDFENQKELSTFYSKHWLPEGLLKYIQKYPITPQDIDSIAEAEAEFVTIEYPKKGGHLHFYLETPVIKIGEEEKRKDLTLAHELHHLIFRAQGRFTSRKNLQKHDKFTRKELERLRTADIIIETEARKMLRHSPELIEHAKTKLLKAHAWF